MANIGIVGATGMVGRTFLDILEERNFPVDNLYLFASAKSKGNIIKFNNKEYKVEELNEKSFDKPMDIALFSAGGNISKKYAPIAKEIVSSCCWKTININFILSKLETIAFKQCNILLTSICLLKNIDTHLFILNSRHH